MADMGPVISAVDEYGDQRFAEGASSRQAEVDAAIADRDRVQAEFDAHMATHEPEPPTKRFPGDPGVGKALFGNNGAWGATSSEQFDAWMYGNSGEKVSLCRIYNGGNMALGSGLRGDLIALANEGRVPMLSTKHGGLTAQQCAGGSADATWRDTARWLADVYPDKSLRYSPFFHEPEDNFPVNGGENSAGLYREAFRRAVATQVAERPELITKVTWCAPWLMEWSYTNASGRDYRNWHPNWSGTGWLHDGPFDVVCADGSVWEGSWVHLDAFDLYNPVVQSTPPSGARNKTWVQSVAAFMQKRANANQPPLYFSIGEYGLHTEPWLDDNGVTVAEILKDTVDIGVKVDGLVDICMWTNDSYAPNNTNDPNGILRNPLAELAKRPEILRAGQPVI